MTKSVVEIIQEALIQADVEVDEFNDVYDQLQAAKSTIEELEKQNNKYKVMEQSYDILKQQSDTILKNGEAHLNVAKQACRERDQTKDKLKTANELLASYKEIGTPKKIREKIKNYQTKVADGTKSVNRSKDLIKGYRKEVDGLIAQIRVHESNEEQTNMASVWSEDGDNLMLFPSRLTMQIGDVQERQLTLLFMTKSGCGKLIAIDEDGNPVECRLPEEGIHPKDKTLEVAGRILRKWRRQGWRVRAVDLDLESA